MRVITAAEVKQHCTDESCYVIRRGRVYDVTKFLSNHPGGKQMILDFAGNDITLLMNASDPHTHSKNAYKTLADLQIGILEGHENDRGIENDFVEPVDWSKPMLAQVGDLGPLYSSWVHTPVDRWVRLFKNNFIELLSKSPWYLVPMFWIPVIFYNISQAYDTLSGRPVVNSFGLEVSLGVWAIPFLFILGAITWPFVEYLLHRFVFHLEPPGNSPALIRFHFTMHGLHHKAPFDPYHLVFPPIPAALIGVLVYATYYALLPECMVNTWFAGTCLGYIVYDLTHYYLHHGHPAPNSYFGRLKKWHIRHHYIDPNNGFGVSSNVLDFPFGTAFPNYKSQ